MEKEDMDALELEKRLQELGDSINAYFACKRKSQSAIQITGLESTFLLQMQITSSEEIRQSIKKIAEQIDE